MRPERIFGVKLYALCLTSCLLHITLWSLVVTFCYSLGSFFELIVNFHSLRVPFCLFLITLSLLLNTFHLLLVTFFFVVPYLFARCSLVSGRSCIECKRTPLHLLYTTRPICPSRHFCIFEKQCLPTPSIDNTPYMEYSLSPHFTRKSWPSSFYDFSKISIPL